jgi:hypothetical protein
MFRVYTSSVVKSYWILNSILKENLTKSKVKIFKKLGHALANVRKEWDLMEAIL